MNRLTQLVTLAVIAAMAMGAPTNLPADEYEVGGPLAGVMLPPHPDGDKDDRELYPGGVEHYRAYMTKYMPIRSLFDRQSQIKLWTTPNIPGGRPSEVVSYTPPVYEIGDNRIGAAPLGERRQAVQAYVVGAASDPFVLDLGELDRGLYALRVIAAVPTRHLRRFRLPLFFGFTVDDGLAGEISRSRFRSGYVDDFYSIVEFYFHAPQNRRYQATVWVDEGSEVNPLIHAISLDNVLAGSEWRPIKRARTLHDPSRVQEMVRIEREKVSQPRLGGPLPTDSRLARDAAIWNSMPPLNRQMFVTHSMSPINVQEGAANLKIAEIEKEFGAWELAQKFDPRAATLTADVSLWDEFLVNQKLNLRYTMSDLRAGRPLPDPYPFRDTGAGVYFPDPKNDSTGRWLAPIAQGIHRILRPAPNLAGAAIRGLAFDNADLLRDAAVDLVRYAYDMPTFDAAASLNVALAQPAFANRELRCRMREAMAMWRNHYQRYLDALETYDLLFPFIEGNSELAASIGRFVPWVRSPDDVRTLLDVYLLQHTAKRILRYHDHTHDAGIAVVAGCAGDVELTRPWMHWLFDRTFSYPLPPTSMEDLVISYDRSGTTNTGSTFYSQNSGAVTVQADLLLYLRGGGDSQFDLSDPRRYPKTMAHAWWQLNTVVAGRDFARIGDVSGPEKPPGFTLGEKLTDKIALAWDWTSDPAWAWLHAHLLGRSVRDETEWTAIQTAATKARRAPWLDLPTRHVPNWFTVLETGPQHDDYRFRRAVYLRTGLGSGHAHADTLDLQIAAHGLPMTIDGGQRSGYSKPNDRFARIHNVAEIEQGSDDYGFTGHTMVRALSDAPGAQFMDVEAMPRGKVRQMRRQVALIDVDEGVGSVSLDIEQQITAQNLPGKVTTANSYVVDFFRLSGGSAHLYNFHAMVNDDFQWNAQAVSPVQHVLPKEGRTGSEPLVLSMFEATASSKFAGDCPPVLSATWRYGREHRFASEGGMLRSSFDADSPRKFTRLHLLESAGMRALRADVNCHHLDYAFTNLMVRRTIHKGELSSNFVAVIEPYVGEPFVQSVRSIAVEGHAGRADQARAVEVVTRSGRTDLLYADTVPDAVRTVGDVKVAGQFAAFLRDESGLVQLTLTGGTTLKTPLGAITPAAPKRRAKVVAVDYAAKTMTIDKIWPQRRTQTTFLVGMGSNQVNYTALSTAQNGEGSTLYLQHGADRFRSRVRQIVAEENTVECDIPFPNGRTHGLDRNIVASNENQTKFWRAEQVRGKGFKLDGPVTDADFAPQGVLRLWEFGVGDEVEQATSVSLQRTGEGTYALRADTAVTISLPGSRVESSPDGRACSEIVGSKRADSVEFVIDEGRAIDSPLHLRIVR